MQERIDGNLFKQMVLFGAAAITLQKQGINDLNVFPVPDGDTGTNMSLTIQTAAAELRKIDPDSVGQAASVTASALLRGARGNSGVILSLLFRGLSKSLKGLQEADGAALAAAMQEGVASAYSAVMKPAEGTVLTVSRMAAKRAVEAAAENNCAEYVLQQAIAQGEETLLETTDMNPVLKKAGVIDAGGKGYLVILNGMLRCLQGEDIPQVAEDPAAESSDETPFDKFSTEEIKFTYCTEFIVSRENDKDPARLRSFLADLGDSLVLVDDDEIIKVHVHTNHPGLALEEALTYGSFITTKVENMKNQHTEILEEARETAQTEPAVAPAEKPYGFLAVCAGDGLAAVFRDLGTDAVVSGGQTMNPSTQDILQAVNRIPAETVFVLPNNKNIVMAAQQCQDLTEKHVVVIPSHTVAQGITAMMNADMDAADPQEIAQAMEASLSTVTTMQITYAARNSEYDGTAIEEGDYLALLEGKLFATSKDLHQLVQQLAQHAKALSPSFITIFYGEDVSAEDAQELNGRFAALCPDAEVSLVEGGQPVYYYIISVE